MKARIKRLDVEVHVCELSVPNQVMYWYDNQISRDSDSGMKFEPESLSGVEIRNGDPSKNYRCELRKECSKAKYCLKEGPEDDE